MGHYRYSILILSLLFLISCFRLVASEQLFVVGENYVGRYVPDRYAEARFELLFTTESGAPLSSQTFFPARCEVVVREKNTGRLSRLPANQSLGQAGELLLDESNGDYLTLDSNLITLRKERGDVVATHVWNPEDEIVAGNRGKAGFTLLTRNRQKMAAHFLSPALETLARRELPSGKDQFPHYHIHESSDGTTWATFSKTVPGATYVPFVTRFTASKWLESFEWSERGLLLDICSQADGTYITRDIPSLPFTVPLVSQLERLEKTGKKSPLFSFEANELPEAMACGGDHFYFAQRSLTGSHNTLIVVSEKGSRLLAELPDKVRRLYLCPFTSI